MVVGTLLHGICTEINFVLGKYLVGLVVVMGGVYTFARDVGSKTLLPFCAKVCPLWVAVLFGYNQVVIRLYFQSDFWMQFFLRCCVHSFLRAVYLHLFIKQTLRLDDPARKTQELEDEPADGSSARQTTTAARISSSEGEESEYTAGATGAQASSTQKEAQQRDIKVEEKKQVPKENEQERKQPKPETENSENSEKKNQSKTKKKFRHLPKSHLRHAQRVCDLRADNHAVQRQHDSKADVGEFGTILTPNLRDIADAILRRSRSRIFRVSSRICFSRIFFFTAFSRICLLLGIPRHQEICDQDLKEKHEGAIQQDLGAGHGLDGLGKHFRGVGVESEPHDGSGETTYLFWGELSISF